MLVLAIVCACAAVVILIWGITRARAASSSAVRAAALEERMRGLDAEVTTGNARASALEAAVTQANERADQQTQKTREAVEEARRSDEMAEDAVQRAIRAEKEAADAIVALAAAEAAAVTAVADRDAVIAGSGPLHPDALWLLEVRRVERLWRDRLKLQPDEPSPFAAAPEDLAAALAVLAEASREESGVVIDLVWKVDGTIRTDRRVQLARIGEELIGAMRESEGGELEVSSGEGGLIEFRVRTLPPIDLPEPLTAALALIGVVPALTDGVVVVSVPPRGMADPDDVETGSGTADAGEVTAAGDDVVVEVDEPVAAEADASN